LERFLVFGEQPPCDSHLWANCSHGGAKIDVNQSKFGSSVPWRDEPGDNCQFRNGELSPLDLFLTNTEAIFSKTLQTRILLAN
jgi:hypothetical protein